MAPVSGTALFYVVFIAPGFIAVSLAISLAAVEKNAPPFNLLAFSLVSSLLIDTIFIGIYQVFATPIRSPAGLSTVLFTPRLRIDYILLMFTISVIVGIIYTGLVLLDAPGRARQILQSKHTVVLTPRQPWSEFMRDARTVRIKTSDDDLYWGQVAEWSRAGRPRQVRISTPYQYNKHTYTFEPIGLDDMILFEDNIDRVVIWDRDKRGDRLLARFRHWRQRRGNRSQ